MNKNISLTDSMTVDGRLLPMHRYSLVQNQTREILFFRSSFLLLLLYGWQQGVFNGLSPA